MILVAADVPPAITICEPSKPARSRDYWSWREIDGRQCWYRGAPGKPKSELRWPPGKQKGRRVRAAFSLAMPEGSSFRHLDPAQYALVAPPMPSAEQIAEWRRDESDGGRGKQYDLKFHVLSPVCPSVRGTVRADCPYALYISHMAYCRNRAYAKSGQAAKNQIFECPMGRRKLWHDVMVTPFPQGTFEHMEAVRGKRESKTDFVRLAVDKELKRRGRASKEKRPPRRKASQ